MKCPIRFVVDNLVWSAHDGSVWAVYKVPAVSYPFLDDREKKALHNQIRAALLALPDESMILSICRNMDLKELAMRMQKDIDSEKHPEWAAEVEATVAMVRELQATGSPVFERTYYLAFRLPAITPAGGFFGAAAALLGARFTGVATPANLTEIQLHRRNANEVGEQLHALIGATPVTAGEVRWLYARAPLRGLAEPMLDASWEPNMRTLGEGAKARLTGPTPVRLFRDAVVFEGGYRPSKARHGIKPDVDPPRHHRYLRIDTDKGTVYQTAIVLSDLPGSWTFPDGLGEWFTCIEASRFPVEWCSRITAVPNEKAQVKSRRQARELVAQVAEYESEPSGPPQILAEAMTQLDEERKHLATNPSDPELQVTTWFSVADTNLPALENKANYVTGLFVPNEYGADRPTGNQEDFLLGALPGTALPQGARHYTQYLLPDGFATSMPFTTNSVGDEDGILLGAVRGSGAFTPVLASFDQAPSRNRSGSWAVFGGLGGGKSYFTKRAARAVLARGGQVVVADRTRHGEYVRFAEVCPGTRQVVELTPESRFRLDPMRVFTGSDRLQYTTGFLALLTGTSPTEMEGVVLSEAVAAVAERPDSGLIDVIVHLENMADDNDARMLARKLRAASRSKLADVTFGEGPSLSLDADLIIFHLPGLTLPDKAALSNPYLARTLLPEQLAGWALLYLVAAVTRYVTFTDPSRFSAGIYDEARMLTLSPYGRQLLLEVVRDGRKHNAAAWIISQHPEDLGDSVGEDDRIADLLGYRLVFNQEEGAAESALEYLGLEPTHSNIETVTSLVSPDGARDALFRDSAGRVGRVQMFLEFDPKINAAFDTNPTAVHAQAAPAPEKVVI